MAKAIHLSLLTTCPSAPFSRYSSLLFSLEVLGSLHLKTLTRMRLLVD